MWDVATASAIQTLTGPSGAIESGVFDGSGSTFYTVSDDGNLFAWDLSGERSFGRLFSAGPGSYGLGPFAYHYFAASPDGRSIAVPYARHLPNGDADGGGVNILDLATGRVTTTIDLRSVPGVSAASYAEFSADGTELLVSPGPSSNGHITLWRLQQGRARLVRTFSGLSADADSIRRFGFLERAVGYVQSGRPMGRWS